jgi:hypothetical protein
MLAAEKRKKSRRSAPAFEFPIAGNTAPEESDFDFFLGDVPVGCVAALAAHCQVIGFDLRDLVVSERLVFTDLDVQAVQRC